MVPPTGSRVYKAPTLDQILARAPEETILLLWALARELGPHHGRMRDQLANEASRRGINLMNMF